MSDHQDHSDSPKNDVIVPASVTLNAAPAAYAEHPNPQSFLQQNRWTLLGLAITGLLALVVIFVLPQYVAQAPHSKPLASDDSSEKKAAPTHVESLQESPWQDAQLSKGRRETQDLLAEMLDRQKELESKLVMQWAAEKFLAAQQMATEADGFYREQNFSAAKLAYQNALNLFDSLLENSREVFSSALIDGEAALQAGDQILALEKFQLAAAIEPDDASATEGLARAERLPQLLTHLDNGKRFQRDSDLDNADKEYTAALKIDPQSIAAKEKSGEVKHAIRERDFAQQMSAGFAALHNNNMAQATAAFERALTIKPDAADARTALTQAKNQQTESRIQQWLQQAEQQEATEEWSAAVATYDKALNIDSNLVAARVGKIRATARADVDKKLVDILAAPERLATPQVHAQYESFLQETTKIQNPGEKLNAQLDQLQTALNNALKPIEVIFVSDESTEVRLNRVADLGKFSSTTLVLKPGQYTAVGTRPGFRDVRLDFTVSPSAQNARVTIKCTEKINNG